jgi:hypothetical protein
MLKKILIGIVVVVLLLVGGAFLLPSSYHVEREVVIAGDSEDVFPHINNLKNWNVWTPWSVERFPKMQVTYTGPEAGVGAESSWTDEDNGDGRMVITKSDPEEGIVYDLFFEGMPKSTGAIELEETGGDADTVRVTMAMDGEMGNNPVSRYFGLLMDSFLGVDFETGLANLKRTVEAPAAEAEAESAPAAASEETAETEEEAPESAP